MKIAIIGSKGIPANYGGFETFAFHLAKILSSKHNITVVNEKESIAGEFNFPVNIVYSDFMKSKNPLKFYKQSIQLVCDSNDIVIVCGVGGSIFYPFQAGKAKLVTNVDGLEHRRGKYTMLQRLFVYGLQRIATLFSHHIVADSNEVEKYWKKRFAISNKKITAISYGAEVPEKFDDSVLTEYSLTGKNYFLVVARLVPENNLQMILNSFAEYKGKKKLVIVGNTSDNPFSQAISNNSSEQIIFTGGIYQKEKLDSLRKNCFAYIHGHSVGGTNPALLEAMAANCICICHNNVFNREVAGENQNYFSNHDELVERLNYLESNPDSGSRFAELSLQRVKEHYSWDQIASQYESLFHSLLPDRKA
jgi:glycosyltransferase involved in cell wall biosynthesis